jgi:hypothetical protein
MAQTHAQHTPRDEAAPADREHPPAERAAPVKHDPPTPTQDEANEQRLRVTRHRRDMQPAPARTYETR